MNISEDKLGKPDLSLAGLQIWIHGREFPNDKGSFDGDWLHFWPASNLIVAEERQLLVY